MSGILITRQSLVCLVFLSIFVCAVHCRFFSFESEPDSSKRTVIDFFYKENFWGKSKHVVLRKDKCMNVPTNYNFEKPRSIWASDCIMIFKKDFCWGHGTRVAGMVAELRSSGLYSGISSVKPCESNIRIHFKG